MAIRPQVLNVSTMRAQRNSPWSAWVQPVMSPKVYTLFCCDCALCHQFQYKVRIGKDGKPRVIWRVKRANLYTQMKRKHLSEKGHIEILKKGEKVVALVDKAMVITLENGLRRGGSKKEKKKGKRRGH